MVNIFGGASKALAFSLPFLKDSLYGFANCHKTLLAFGKNIPLFLTIFFIILKLLSQKLKALNTSVFKNSVIKAISMKLKMLKTRQYSILKFP